MHPPAGIYVETVHPERGPALEAVYAIGNVEATVMLPIAPRNTARLVELKVDEGDAVAKNQMLARLEDKDLIKSLEALQANEKLAQENYDRVAALEKRGVETKKNLQQAIAEMNAARATVEQVAAQIDYMKLLSPADGRIIRRDGEIGQTIPANQPVFWLACCAPLRISAEVDEEDIAVVKIGQKVLIRADAFPDKIFHGTVQGITPMGDPVARSYRVRISFVEETPLQIGMTAESNIIISAHDNAILLPNSSIVQNKVLLVKEGNLVVQPVKTGAHGPEQTEILGGVSLTDEVILHQKPEMTPGRKVRTRIVPQTP